MGISSKLQQILFCIKPLRAELTQHPVYQNIKSVDALRVFMEHHVFAVWDFMSLLKALQRSLTCVEVPWVPSCDPISRRLINEIVLAEESDEDGAGGYASHFELYLNAMREAGARTEIIEDFLTEIKRNSVKDSLFKVPVPSSAREFVLSTWSIVESNCPHRIAAAFTLGREEIIPDMFRSLVTDLGHQFPNQLDQFRYYLERHVELDGDHHAPMAMRMLDQIAGDDPIKWSEVKNTATFSLQARHSLWDGILKETKDYQLTKN